MTLLLVATVGKLADLQVLRPSRYLSQGAEQRIVNVKLQAARGAILDRNGEDLALSIPRSTVVADPEQVSDIAKEAALLAEILGKEKAELVELLGKPGRFIYLERLVSEEQATAIREAHDLGKLDGIDLIEEYERVRPGGNGATSILGLTDIDGVGIAGLEEQYDETLLGIPGDVVYEESSLGSIAGGQRNVVPSSPGDDVVLSIDQQLQYEAERVVADHVTRAGAKGGIAIVSRPQTGEILAMANMDTDSETEKVTPSTNNRALTAVFEPGSVSKVISVAAALEEGTVTPDTVMDVPDNLHLGGADFGEAEALPQQMSVTDILIKSSNIGTIRLAESVGKTRLDNYLRKFGFGSKTSLAFPNESPGLLLATDEWSGSSIGSIPLGQGISVTPLQMLLAYNIIANDGNYVEPKLVVATVDSDGVRHPTKSPDPKTVISPETAQQLRVMLAGVVTSGTGTNAAVPGYRLAGKTGTARKPLDEHLPDDGYMDLNGRYHYVSTFVGMFPAEDPQLSMIVILDEPDSAESYYASDTAAPLFAALTKTLVRLLHIPPSDVSEVNGSLAVFGADTASPESDESGLGQDSPGTVPELSGDSAPSPEEQWDSSEPVTPDTATSATTP